MDSDSYKYFMGRPVGLDGTLPRGLWSAKEAEGWAWFMFIASL